MGSVLKRGIRRAAAAILTVSPVVNPKVEMFSAQYCTDWSVSMIVPTLQDIVGRGLEYKY